MARVEKSSGDVVDQLSCSKVMTFMIKGRMVRGGSVQEESIRSGIIWGMNNLFF